MGLSAILPVLTGSVIALVLLLQSVRSPVCAHLAHGPRRRVRDTQREREIAHRPRYFALREREREPQRTVRQTEKAECVFVLGQLLAVSCPFVSSKYGTAKRRIMACESDELFWLLGEHVLPRLSTYRLSGAHRENRVRLY